VIEKGKLGKIFYQCFPSYTRKLLKLRKKRIDIFVPEIAADFNLSHSSSVPFCALLTDKLGTIISAMAALPVVCNPDKKRALYSIIYEAGT